MKSTGVTANVWFVCSLQRRQELLRTANTIVQLHGEQFMVAISGVPAEEVAAGVVSAHVLCLAESAFLEQQSLKYSDFELIAWEARYGTPDGPLLSRYRVLLAAAEPR